MFLRPLLTALLVTAAFSGTSLANEGHQGSGKVYGEPGNTKKTARTIMVTMREDDGKMLFIPNKVEIRQGEQIKFVIRNNGELDHEIVLGTLEENLKHGAQMQNNPDMEHDDPNAKRLSSKQTGEIVWKFTKTGTFDFSCLIPGHREAGMSGTIVVTPKTGAL